MKSGSKSKQKVRKRIRQSPSSARKRDRAGMGRSAGCTPSPRGVRLDERAGSGSASTDNPSVQTTATDWIPSVTKTTLLFEGVNDETGRKIRIYVRPGRRVTFVEELN